MNELNGDVYKLANLNECLLFRTMLILIKLINSL